MAESHEILTRDGLVYLLMTDIARQERKYDISGWNGDRALSMAVGIRVNLATFPLWREA